MPDTFAFRFPASRQAAFSLLELIVTISIVVVLMALAAPALMDAISTSRLTGSGDFVYNKLSQARQQAITDSRDIRVRIYATGGFTGEEGLRENAGDPLHPGDGRFDSLQFLGWQNDGSDEILTDVFSLEEGVTISRSPRLSSLIASLPQSQGILPGSTTKPAASWVEFAFLPDGSTNLPAAISPVGDETRNNWFLTLVPGSAASPGQSDARPRDFYCIQIDPDTGGLTVYRP